MNSRSDRRIGGPAKSAGSKETPVFRLESFIVDTKLHPL
jgi:hypothetical protein